CHFAAPDSVQEGDPQKRISRSNAMTRHLFAAAPLFILMGSGAALAADPSGMWLTQNGASRIKLADCGGAICGTIVWLKEPIDKQTGKPPTDEHNPDPAKRSRPLHGIQVMYGMRPSGAGKWTGHLYNADDGKTYEGNLVVLGPDRV